MWLSCLIRAHVTERYNTQLDRNFTLYSIGISFMRYLFAEVSHGYLLEEDEQLYSEKQRRVTTFMKTPRELEKVCYTV